ncbi:PhoD-like phosphatase [Fragilaria crotonensis]|nr:PhoD-like phosphatase [Fragilaria crotonensis]
MTVLPSRIAFGSCNNQDLQNNLWPIIERRKPAGFVWGGDSIYADHDYGCDNADRTYPYRIESAEAFVDFIGEPKDSAMTKRAKAGLGVYGVKVFDFDRPQGRQALSDSEAGIDHHAVVDHGDPPSYSNKSVAVFVLDVRSNKSPWKKGYAFTPDLDGDFWARRNGNGLKRHFRDPELLSM